MKLHMYDHQAGYLQVVKQRQTYQRLNDKCYFTNRYMQSHREDFQEKMDSEGLFGIIGKCKA